MASAAASLKKSLPPLSAKKSPFKSAKKAKVPTPRQSRLSIKPSEAVCTEEEPAMTSEESASCAVINIAEQLVEVMDVAVDTTSSGVEVVVVVPEAVAEDLSVAQCVMPEESAIIIEEEAVPVPESVALPVPPCDVSSSTPKRSVRSKAVKSAVKLASVQKVTVTAEVPVEEVVSVECVPAVEEVVSVECVPAVEEVVSVECVPAVEEVVSVQSVPVVEIALVVPTPARVTRSKISTPTVTVSAQGPAVVVAAPRSSRRSCVATAATKSEMVVVEQVEPTLPVSFENEENASEQAAEVSQPEASAVKGRGKRMSVASTKPVEAPSAIKRSRRGQGIELDSAVVAVTESSNSTDTTDVPAIEIASQNVSSEEPISVVKPTPARSSRKVPIVVPVEEVKSAPRGRGRPPRGVKHAIELEDEEEEEEEEEALALLCDG